MHYYTERKQKDSKHSQMDCILRLEGKMWNRNQKRKWEGKVREGERKSGKNGALYIREVSVPQRKSDLLCQRALKVINLSGSHTNKEAVLTAPLWETEHRGHVGMTGGGGRLNNKLSRTHGNLPAIVNCLCLHMPFNDF